MITNSAYALYIYIYIYCTQNAPDFVVMYVQYSTAQCSEADLPATISSSVYTRVRRAQGAWTIHHGMLGVTTLTGG